MDTPKRILFSLLILLAQKNIGQVTNPDRDIFMEGNYQYGYLLPHIDYLAFFVQEPIQSFQFTVGKVVSGDKMWHQAFNYPSFGVGYYQSSLSNDKVYGHLYSVYCFVDRYYLNINNRFNIGNRLDIGLAYASRFYHPQKNPYNMAIGTRFNVYVHFSLETSYSLSQHLKLLTGIGLSHTSNGAFKKPNTGLNYVTTSASLQYHFSKMPHRIKQPLVDADSSKKNEFIVYTAYGRKNISRLDNKQFPLYSVNLAYNRKLYISSYVGLNLYFSYDPSIVQALHVVNPDSVVTSSDQLRIAINASYEIRMGNLSFAFQPGVYLKNKVSVAHSICNRLGIRYYADCGLMLALTLNAHWFAKSDVVEWGIGYRFKK